LTVSFPEYMTEKATDMNLPNISSKAQDIPGFLS